MDYVCVLDHFINKTALGFSLRSPSVDSHYRIHNLKMNPAVVRLLHLRQGDQAIEEYVQDFCELCHLVAFNDVALKGIVHPKMKILSSFTHPQVVPNLYEFLCSAEHKGRYFEESLKKVCDQAVLGHH